MSTVPALPVPFIYEETEVLNSVECDRPMQLVSAWHEECVAADLPHFSRRSIYSPHPHPQTPGQNQ